MMPAVKIHDLTKNPPQSYLARFECECKDDTDRAVFRLVLHHDDIITIGKVIGEPVRNKSTLEYLALS